VTTEVLIMCPACGRPQFAAARCVACGGELPESLAPPTENPAANRANGRDQLLQAFDPYLEASLGNGKVLKLSQRRAEWADGQKPVRQLDLRQVSHVTLVRRPVWEALLFLPLGLGFLAVPWWGMKVVGGVFCLLVLAAAFLQRRWWVECHRTDGPVERWDFGFGRPNTPVVQRMESVWGSFSQELGRLGVSVKGPV